jgi:hypothetical protein
MLDGDVDNKFTTDDFRKIISSNTDKLTFEMAVRFVNRYYENKRGLIEVPNLGLLPPKEERRTYSATGQRMVSVVKYALENMEKGMYLKFRTGQISLAQAVNQIQAQQEGKAPLPCFDDMKEDMDPTFLEPSSKYAKLAYRDEKVE